MEGLLPESNVIEFPKNISHIKQKEMVERQEKQIQTLRLSGLFLLACCLILTMGYTTYRNYTKLASAKQQLNELVVIEEKSYMERQVAQEELDRLLDPEYVLELARRDLFYSKPGEVLFDIPVKDRRLSTQQE